MRVQNAVMRRLRFLPALRACSVAFLSVPWLVFTSSWLRPGWAMALLALHAYMLLSYVTHEVEEPSDPHGGEVLTTTDRVGVRVLLLIALLAVAWTSFSGAGGVGFQNQPDWNNKNALMRDLMLFDWPVGYENDRVLNYYFALYLPASFVGRIAGWDAAQWFLYAEVLVGVILALLWLYSFSGKLGAAALLMFMAFGGLDIVGYLLTLRHMPARGGGIEWWAQSLQFSGNTTLLYWVPQHCLPGWIITALILDEVARFRRVAYTGFFVALCLLWSPFVAAGLIPIALGALFIANGAGLRSVANFVYLPVMSALAYALYSPHKAGSHVDAPLSYWKEHFSVLGLRTMAIFIALEVGVYAVFVAGCWTRLDRPWRTLAKVVGVSAVLWMLVPERAGHGGFNMRASIPALFVLFLLVLHVFSVESRALRRVAIAACLMLGSVAALQEITRSAVRYPSHVPAPPPATGVLGLRNKQMNELLMPLDSRLYRLLFRAPSEVAHTDTMPRIHASTGHHVLHL